MTKFSPHDDNTRFYGTGTILLSNNLLFLVRRKELSLNFFKWLKVFFFIAGAGARVGEKILGAGQKWTGSATLVLVLRNAGTVTFLGGCESPKSRSRLWLRLS